jgi:hypothetical protein
MVVDGFMNCLLLARVHCARPRRIFKNFLEEGAAAAGGGNGNAGWLGTRKNVKKGKKSLDLLCEKVLKK